MEGKNMSWYSGKEAESKEDALQKLYKHMEEQKDIIGDARSPSALEYEVTHTIDNIERFRSRSPYFDTLMEIAKPYMEKSGAVLGEGLVLKAYGLYERSADAAKQEKRERPASAGYMGKPFSGSEYNRLKF